jgi:hypothetical protein
MGFKQRNNPITSLGIEPRVANLNFNNLELSRTHKESDKVQRRGHHLLEQTWLRRQNHFHVRGELLVGMRGEKTNRKHSSWALGFKKVKQAGKSAVVATCGR